MKCDVLTCFWFNIYKNVYQYFQRRKPDLRFFVRTWGKQKKYKMLRKELQFMESQNLQICLVNIFNFGFNYYFRVLLIYSHTTKKSYKSNNLSYSIFQNLNSSSMLAKCGTRMLTKAWKRQKSLKWSLCPRALTGEIMGQWRRSKTRLDVYDNYMVVSFSAFTMLSVIGC